jgi:hypothetical protein
VISNQQLRRRSYSQQAETKGFDTDTTQEQIGHEAEIEQAAAYPCKSSIIAMLKCWLQTWHCEKAGRGRGMTA